MGYADLSSYDSTICTTPNLDKLAASGMRFTSFYFNTNGDDFRNKEVIHEANLIFYAYQYHLSIKLGILQDLFS